MDGWTNLEKRGKRSIRVRLRRRLTTPLTFFSVRKKDVSLACVCSTDVYE